ncbi:MAG: reverse transcriptase/maturase family protein [Bdellovibrionaceae bacterium]|nr:reverse transcriptase/maturase family protein [Pseudobdellovibrionaceae bacterium]
MPLSFKELLDGYNFAKNGHRGKKCVRRFIFYLERELLTLEAELKENRYSPRPLRRFFIHKPKQRHVAESHFRDRVVHHALTSVIEGPLVNHWVMQSYACRKGLGPIKAVKNFYRIITGWQAFQETWVLKFDIKKYFDSIPHDRLIELLSNHPEVRPYLGLIQVILHHGSFEKGLPIGHLTSQFFANFYLNELDRYLLHHLGCKNFFRYMDDILIIHHEKNFLLTLLGKVQEFCSTQLKVELHPRKIFLRPSADGIEFLGFLVRPASIQIKPSNLARIRRRLRSLNRQLLLGMESIETIRRRLVSWRGYAQHGSSPKQFEALVRWSARLRPDLHDLCRTLFLPRSLPQSLPHATGQQPVPKPTQQDGKTSHSVLCPWLLIHGTDESESAFFQVLQWSSQVKPHAETLTQWPESPPQEPTADPWKSFYPLCIYEF